MPAKDRHTAMMPRPAQRLDLSFLPNNQWFARTLVFFVLCFIVVGCRYGRFFERGFPALIPFIPYVGLGLLALGFIVLFSLKIFDFKKLIFALKNHTQVHLLLVALVTVFLAGEQLNEMPIERIHILKYTPLTVFLYYSFANHRRHWRLLFLASAVAAVIGMSEEFAQRWMPDRIFDPKDLVLNLIAVALGTILLQIVHTISQTKIST